MDLTPSHLLPSADRVRTIAFVGDSQPRALDGMLFTDPSRPGTIVMPVVRRTQYFRASRFFDGTRFDERMTHIWWEVKCAIQTPEAGDAIFTPFVFPVFQEVRTSRALRRNPGAPPIVISCGGVDLWDLEVEIVGRYTFEPDPRPPALDDLPPYDAAERISQERILAMIEERCAPVFAGIRALRATGFENIFVFGNAPPMMEDRPGWKPLRLRYLMRYAFNQVYERLAPLAGATYVDIWNPFLKNGVRDDRYFEDPEHANAAGAAIIMNQIYAKLNRCGSTL